MVDLLILIPSYRRELVLYKTLSGLLENTSPEKDGLKVGITVGLNAGREYERNLCWQFQRWFGLMGIPFSFRSRKDNIGKAAILNEMFEEQCGIEAKAVVTMDNDMVIKKPWLGLMQKAIGMDIDMVGFGSSTFWAHLPTREECEVMEYEGCKVYKPYGVAGGMLLFKPEILKRYPWTNHGGVYGRDDATMCDCVDRKAVLHWDEDWLDHDPWGRKIPSLCSYDEKKKALYKSGTTVFPAGWDE
jgi:hypothetical protein